MTNTTKENKDDHTGKSRAVGNVLTSWASHFILIIIGFIMPRMIHDNLGQEDLGVWDLCWSFVNYLSLTGMGVGSSVNRYVAKYRSLSDYLSLNRAISSVVFIQFLMAVSIVILTFILVWSLPFFLKKDTSRLMEVSWVVGILGGSIAVQMAFDTSRGVLSGMHRWDIYNGLNALSRILIAIFMVGAIVVGGDLVVLAAIHFTGTLLAEITRSVIARRLCKELSLKREYVNFYDIKKMFKFGMKSIISGVPNILVSQTLNIVTASLLGPAALAVYARPKALIGHVETLLNKFSFVLTPMVGSIQATEDVSELRVFLVESVKFAVAFTLPTMLFLAIMGDHVMNIWMGSEYADLKLILILSIGYFLPVSQGPCLRVLMGMNKHGRLAIINLIVSVVLLSLGMLLVYYIGWSLVNVALLATSILTLTIGTITPIYTCRVIGIGVFEYLVKTFTKPAIIGLVLSIWLILCRQLTGFTSLGILLTALSGQLLIVTILYWMFLLPDNLKASFMKGMSRD